MAKTKIYFLCTGNSCRSQMAEGYAKQLLPQDQYEIKSAGIEAHGLNPLAVEVMKEDKVDISNQCSKVIDPEYYKAADLIITLCGDAKDRCPAIPLQASHIHWALQDPAQAKGRVEQRLMVFRDVRDIIKQKIIQLRLS